MIKVESLTVTKKNHKIVDNINFSIPKHSFCAFFGPNGAGKSTILRCLSGMEDMYLDHISYDQHRLTSLNIFERSQKIAWQPPEVHLPFSYRVQELLMYSRYPWHKGAPNKSDYTYIEEILTDLNLKKFRNEIYSELSTGEQKQIMIARALVQDTPYIILDEPCSHLDLSISHKILNYLKYLTTKNKTIIASIHNLNLGQKFTNYSILVNKGTIVKSDASRLKLKLIEDVFEVRPTYTVVNNNLHLLCDPF